MLVKNQNPHIMEKGASMLANPTEDRMISAAHPTRANVEAGVDPSWKNLYKAGGISAFLYIILALAVPLVQVLTMEYFSLTSDYGGLQYLQFIAENRSWWLIAQTLLLGSSILAMVTFVALFFALKHINKSYAALGAIITLTCQLLFLAYYPVLLGTVYLSDKFVTASASQRVFLGAAADSLIAINNAFNPLYEPLFALGILIFSLVMLMGLFHKSIAYLGIVTCGAALVAAALWPVLNVAYLWWWVFFMIWFAAVGWKLYHLGEI
jgi:hypothetical protein